MKKKIFLLFTLTTCTLATTAQSSLIYSLARPIGGGDLRLLETDFSSGAESVIATYTSLQIDDYDLGSTTFDHQNGRFIALGSDTSGSNVFIVGLNTASGNIDYTYTSSNYELFSVEYYNGNAYSLARPIGGGDLRLLETDLNSGAESVIDSYMSSELVDYDPGTTSFDYQNMQFTVLSFDLAANVSATSINTGNGDIDYSFSSTTYELFSIESAGTLPDGIHSLGQISANLKLFPNPTNNYVRINCNASIFRIEITDMLGSVVRSSSVSTTYLDISNLGSGTYFVHVYSNKGIKSGKLIIK